MVPMPPLPEPLWKAASPELQAAVLALAQSYEDRLSFLEDRLSDLEAGAAAGCRTVLVRTGYGTAVNAAELDRDALKLELVAADLADAVEKLGLGRAPGPA
jgi:phosphoglycolate phosphatase-like HAD superfamily hydrolase